MTFATLSPRERWMLLGGGALILALALWRFGWQPVQAERALLREDIARYLTLMHLADQAGDVPARGTDADTRPVAQRVTQSAEAAGLVLTRLAAEGDGLRVTIEEAGFEPLMRWIAALEAEHGVIATLVELDRRPAPGMVSGRLTLEPVR